MRRKIMAGLVALLATASLAGGISTPAQAGRSDGPGVEQADRSHGLGKAPRVATHAGPSSAGVHALKAPPAKFGGAFKVTLSGVNYTYNSGLQNITSPASAGGVQAGLNVGNPNITGGYHSLGELAVIRTISGQRNIVEVGWTKDVAVCGGTGGPCLFGFWWKAGVGTCYNGCGWVDYAPNTMNLGAALTSGTTYTMGIQWDATGTAWWLWSNTGTGTTNNWLGYYDDTLWTANNAYGAPVTGFTSPDQVQAFGEGADDDAFGSGLACLDLGKGVQGSVGNTTAAYMSSVTLINPSAGLATSLSALQVPSGYSGNSMLWPNGSVRTFYWGGPDDC